MLFELSDNLQVSTGNWLAELTDTLQVFTVNNIVLAVNQLNGCEIIPVVVSKCYAKERDVNYLKSELSHSFVGTEQKRKYLR